MAERGVFSWRNTRSASYGISQGFICMRRICFCFGFRVILSWSFVSIFALVLLVASLSLPRSVFELSALLHTFLQSCFRVLGLASDCFCLVLRLMLVFCRYISLGCTFSVIVSSVIAFLRFHTSLQCYKVNVTDH